ncbi:MAG: tRNA (adenosine(37)-N6)-threonylcarbamoyltransferase complex transferase subunit TsaD, partial [Planctomycetes bacterium]|nr:tRNA (adenosine(37)-N6)-threonylcarbamoyltransferase complex transferase subunit TsaD [Planctomycetota bacterium]
MQPTLILGIESSCDETAAALVADGSHILSTALASQIDLHKKYGGVVPEIAARAHIENIIPILRETIRQARILPDRIDAVAVAACPGLAPALLIGVTAAKTLAWAWQKPLIAINHIHAHIISPLLPNSTDSPSLQPKAYSLQPNSIALVVSGGHTSLYHCLSPLEVTLIGKTLDDAAGEAFDKVAAILKLPYPGGPSIEKLANDGNPNAFDFPRSLLGKDSLDFSFSGLKTAVLYHCRGKNMKGIDRVPTMTRSEKADIAASFQKAVCDVLVQKTIRAA